MHNSYLVNLEKLRGVEREISYPFRSGLKVPITRTYKQELDESTIKNLYLDEQGGKRIDDRNMYGVQIDFLVMYLFALCFFKPRRRIGKRIDFIILIVVAVMASFINDYFANSDINLVVTIIFIVVVLGFFEGNENVKLFL